MSLFSWLPLSDRKTLPSVRVLYRDIDYAAGMYYPKASFKYIDEELDLDRGESDVIVLSTRWGDPAASVISHEHRHFQQYYLQGLPAIGVVVPFDTTVGWKAGIKTYYKGQPWEMDALLYSQKIHPDETNDQQMEAVFS